MFSNSGIYEIRNMLNGNRYIGSAINLMCRRTEHKIGLENGRHHSKYLQRAWNKYGKESFMFNVLLYCDKENLILYEQRCIDGLKPEYNILPTAGSNLGCVWSKETRANMSAAHIGITPWNKGKKGLQVAWNKGLKALYPMSEETRRKMSESRKGIPHGPLSEEVKKKIGDANRGKLKPHSDEHKRNQSEATKRQWRRQKGNL